MRDVSARIVIACLGMLLFSTVALAESVSKKLGKTLLEYNIDSKIVTFSYVDKFGIRRSTRITFPESTSGKYIAAFDKFIKWDKISKKEKMTGIEKEIMKFQHDSPYQLSDLEKKVLGNKPNVVTVQVVFKVKPDSKTQFGTVTWIPGCRGLTVVTSGCSEGVYRDSKQVQEMKTLLADLESIKQGAKKSDLLQ